MRMYQVNFPCHASGDEVGAVFTLIKSFIDREAVFTNAGVVRRVNFVCSRKDVFFLRSVYSPNIRGKITKVRPSKGKPV